MLLPMLTAESFHVIDEATTTHAWGSPARRWDFLPHRWARKTQRWGSRRLTMRSFHSCMKPVHPAPSQNASRPSIGNLTAEPFWLTDEVRQPHPWGKSVSAGLSEQIRGQPRSSVCADG